MRRDLPDADQLTDQTESGRGSDSRLTRTSAYRDPWARAGITQGRPRFLATIAGQAEAEVEKRQASRVHVGRVELIAEQPVARSRFRANLAACRWLLVAVLLVQLADIVSTQVALFRGFVEENGVPLGLVHGSAVGAVALKLAAILAVLALALVRLPAHRARVAVSLALALSLIGPVANIAALVGGR